MAVKDVVLGGVCAFALSGFVLLPPGPQAPRQVELSAVPASMTVVDGDSASPSPTWSGDRSVSALGLEGDSDLGSGDAFSFDFAFDGSQDGTFVADDAISRAGARISPALRLAYEQAARAMPPSCNLSPMLLAAIGQVESGNLAGRSIGPDNVVRPAVLGPPLTGGPYASIPDTDGGRHDGSTVFDRAVGPMQFIPSTWRTSGRDGDGDGIADPQNVFDAALSAAGYLCAGGRDLATPEGLTAALWSYNRSTEYAATVRVWYARFTASGLEGIDVDRGTLLADSPRLPVPREVEADVEPTLTPTHAPTPTATPTPTPTPSSTTATATPSPSATATPTATATPSECVAATPTPTATPSATATPAPTATAEPTPTDEPTPTPTATLCGQEATPTPSPSVSSSSTSAATSAPSPSPSLTAAIGGSAASEPATTASPSVAESSSATASPSTTRLATPDPQQTATP